MYYLYILLCSDKSLYTGITNNIENRLQTHRDGEGSKYVRSRLPFRLIYTEKLENKSKALRRELEIKSWSREEKIKNLNLKLSFSI
ncbi:GIY-YIG nuclease family protein [Candidatus Dojkabacteria bacterium]|nr:GIY-YIG nuclease family protein [Candidatus Dojkabacteria bacterium]